MKSTSVLVFALLLFILGCHNGPGKDKVSNPSDGKASTASNASNGSAQKPASGPDSDQDESGLLSLNPNYNPASLKGPCEGRPCEEHPLDGQPLMKEGGLPGDKWSQPTLDPVEEKSLKSALAEVQTHGKLENLHVHADVVNGELQFSPGRDHDEHVSGNEPEVKIADATGKAETTPVKMKASPAAMKAMSASMASH